MALHQILVYGNYKVDSEPNSFLIKDYIFDFPELLKKERIISMVNRAVDENEFFITDIQIIRE